MAASVKRAESQNVVILRLKLDWLCVTVSWVTKRGVPVNEEFGCVRPNADDTHLPIVSVK
ncbi:Uncharacterised protein [Vibrio cholerae]|nr:Uncharacterised protein [Vibrio cholerae]